MQLNHFFRSLLAAYACGAGGDYDSARQDYSHYAQAGRSA
jgi:hypothetical protein